MILLCGLILPISAYTRSKVIVFESFALPTACSEVQPSAQHCQGGATVACFRGAVERLIIGLRRSPSVGYCAPDQGGNHVGVDSGGCKGSH